MKVVKIAYNNECKSILNVFQDFPVKIILETFNYDFHKEKKNAIALMTRFGALSLPLIVFADENLDEYSAIWNEDNLIITPELIIKFLNNGR